MAYANDLGGVNFKLYMIVYCLCYVAYPSWGLKY